MNILVVGSGGREHTLVWKILKSPRVDKVYCAPGNGGISKIAESVDIDVTDLNKLTHFAQKQSIDLTVVGPELPLTLGIVDAFKEKGLEVFGPSKLAAELEGSKAFSKDLMKKYHIPTAEYQVFTEPDSAFRYLQSIEPPVVLKADGLAAGKGVLVCNSRNEMFDGAEKIMTERAFGEAGDRLIVEECLVGEEVSVLAITDGEDMLLLPPSQDHKPIFEGDKGPNTGGMGAYSPAPVMTDKLLETVKEKILIPTIQGMKSEGRLYQGVLYAGLMITSEGPKVLEYNCRFGDPEIQSILPLLESDIIDLIEAALDGKIKTAPFKLMKKSAVCVVMASGGYPNSYKKGMVIHGLDRDDDNVVIFHAGTKAKGKDIVTSGGRVLGVTSINDTIESAIKSVYQAVGSITFDGAYYRRDIGQKALNR
ncbi:phosphoribosylamine--glycine ligase [bacterium I07]|nr:phosphoribosylamine--glycine ligase [bacterium I07]